MDYYNLLGLQSNATDSEIKKAYRELSFKYHPDKNVNATDFQRKENEKKIKEINEAYETLKDPNLRRQYDNRNADPFQHIFSQMFNSQPGFNVQHSNVQHSNLQHSNVQHQQRNSFRNPYQTPMMNIFDIINEIHSQNGAHGEPFVFTTMYEQPNTPTVIPTIDVKVDVTLEQSFTGTQIPITIEREIKNGQFSYHEEEKIYISIPAGIDSSEIITIPEKGNEYNKKKGDIKVQVCLKPHEVFERKGLNLIYKHTITFKESIVGFDFVLNHIDNSSFKIKNIRGSIIQNLEEKTIKGKGFSRDGTTGDLIIVFKVVSPKLLSEEQLTAFESIL
jgi:DnaJ family protein B protein 4